MPGYGFADDELQKLFAEAGNAVKKKVAEPGAAAAPPAAPAPSADATPTGAAAPSEDDFTISTPTPRPTASAPAAAASGGETRLVGGEQTDAALVGRTQAGTQVTISWGQIKGLSLGRVGERMILAFTAGGALYWFSDDNVAYKGLLRQMASTQPMNWRNLVNEIAEHVADRSDAGVQAVSGAGGMVPKFLEQGAFFNGVRGR